MDPLCIREARLLGTQIRMSASSALVGILGVRLVTLGAY